jgi:hypothetical protein
MFDGVHVVGAGLLEESLDVVCWRLRMALDAAPSGHNVLHVRAVRLLAIIIIIMAGHDSGLLRMPPLASFMAPWTVMMYSVSLLLSGAVSLPPRTGRGPTASLLVACWVVRLSSSMVV